MTKPEPVDPQFATPDLLDTEVITVATPAPVFVDSTGRRSRWLRWTAYGFGALVLAYGGLISVSLAGGPVRSSAVLPLPGLEPDEEKTATTAPAPAPPSPAPVPSPSHQPTAALPVTKHTVAPRTSASRPESVTVKPILPTVKRTPTTTPKPVVTTSRPVESATTSPSSSAPTTSTNSPSPTPLPPGQPTPGGGS